MKRNITEIMDEITQETPYVLEDEKLTLLAVWKAEGFELDKEHTEAFTKTTNMSMIQLIRTKKLQELDPSQADQRRRTAMEKRNEIDTNQAVLKEF